jgi:hypothetical protein
MDLRHATAQSPDGLPSFDEFLAYRAGLAGQVNPIAAAPPPHWSGNTPTLVIAAAASAVLVLGAALVIGLRGRPDDRGFELAERLVRADRGNVQISCIAFSCPEVRLPGSVQDAPQDSPPSAPPALSQQPVTGRATPVAMIQGTTSSLALPGGNAVISNGSGQTMAVRLLVHSSGLVEIVSLESPPAVEIGSTSIALRE